MFGKILTGALVLAALAGFSGWIVALQQARDMENRFDASERQRSELEAMMAMSSDRLSSREHALNKKIKELESRWLEEKDSLTSQVLQLNSEAAAREKQVAEQALQLKKQDKAVLTLEADRSRDRARISEMTEQAALLNRKITDLEQTLREKSSLIRELEGSLTGSRERAARELAAVQTVLSQREGSIQALEQTLADREAAARDLETALADRAAVIQGLEKTIAAKNDDIIALREGFQVSEARSQQTFQQEISRLKADQEKEIQGLESVADTFRQLAEDLEVEIREKTVSLEQVRENLRVKILNQILFDSGSARISPEGIRVLDTIGHRLGQAVNEALANRMIKIEGHSDDRPIGPKISATYPTNWELSAARANNVVRYLAERTEIPVEKLFAANYAQYRPAADNGTREGRALNRRIEIVLMPTVPDTP